MLVFGGLTGPQLMYRLELLSPSTLTYVIRPGAGESRKREYSIVYIKIFTNETSLLLC